MFEKFQESLAPRRKFILRLLKSVLVGVVIIAVAQFVGMVGYHAFEGMSWIDAFANAAMILSGMGPLTPLTTTGGKLFAGFYALFSGLAFILIVGIIFAPIVHRFFHKFHLDDDEDVHSKRKR
jgi:hypothetical protein